MTRHFGIYRAVVTNASDPQGRRRLQVAVPDVLGTQPAWAEACVPAGSRAQPGHGAVVWVQFEAGDAGRAVWIGVKPK